jgi:inorganic triphosphatase YgiF
MHKEFELKLQLPLDKARSLRRELIGRGATVVERVDHYFDTAALDLSHAGLSLRLREAQGHWVQTLKAENGALAARAEHEVRRSEAPRPMLAPDLHLHHATDVGLRLMRTLQHAAEPALLESFVVRAARSACSVTKDDGQIEVALDEGVIEAAGRSLRCLCAKWNSSTRRAIGERCSHSPATGSHPAGYG